MLVASSMIGARRRSGYVLLISVIAIGALVSIIVASVMLLGVTASRVGQSVRHASQALELAQGCAEVALRSLRASPGYQGEETLALDTGVCEILSVGGAGNSNRLLCVEGRAGETVRRLEIVIDQLLPATRISSWAETYAFTLCE